MQADDKAKPAGRGMLVTLEGGEGCGKSTQAKRIVSALAAAGIEAVSVREPGGTWLCERIRPLIKDQSDEPPCARSEALLFLAARAQLVERVIRPALAAGKWVVCDRFTDSTIAYQGYGRGLPMEFLHAANAFACGGLRPDLTLLLDTDPAVAAKRLGERESSTNTAPDRIERAGREFHDRIRRGFAALAAAEPDRFAVVDANGTPDQVWEEIWKFLKPFL